MGGLRSRGRGGLWLQVGTTAMLTSGTSGCRDISDAKKFFACFYVYVVCVSIRIYICMYIHVYMCSTAVVRDECVLGIDTRREEGTTPW